MVAAVYVDEPLPTITYQTRKVKFTVVGPVEMRAPPMLGLRAKDRRTEVAVIRDTTAAWGAGGMSPIRDVVTLALGEDGDEGVDAALLLTITDTVYDCEGARGTLVVAEVLMPTIRTARPTSTKGNPISVHMGSFTDTTPFESRVAAPTTDVLPANVTVISLLRVVSIVPESPLLP